MVKLNAHFDGRAIVPDDPASLPLRPGTRLTVSVEAVNEPARASTPETVAVAETFRPLDIPIDPALSNEVALDPRFNIEES